MKRAEMFNKLAKLEGWETVPELEDTFIERVPYDEQNTIQYIRPIVDDIALATSTRNLPDDQAFSHVSRLLAFGTTNLDKLRASDVTRISPYDSGIKKFDSFVGFAPSIAQFLTEDNAFGNRLLECTWSCYAINHIEFSGTESEPEAFARLKTAKLVDLKRSPTPAIFCRYRKLSGQRSHKHLAIATLAETKGIIEQLPEDGGIVELENWERTRLTLIVEGDKRKIEATFGGETRPVSVKAALELMEVLTTKGAKAAEKEWK
jgi:hypothetical protein